jgi:hypothetical protein
MQQVAADRAREAQAKALEAKAAADRAKAAADDVAKQMTSKSVARTASGFSIRTPYDARIVEAIKSIPGAQFDGATKTWAVPHASAATLQQVIPKIDAIAEPLRVAQATQARQEAAAARRQARIDAINARADAEKAKAADRAVRGHRTKPITTFDSQIRGGGVVGSQAYVARIEGTHTRYNLARSFLSGDGRHVSRSGRSGVRSFAVHAPGLYEIERLGTHGESIARQSRAGGGIPRHYVRVTNTGAVRDVSVEKAKALAVRAERLAPRIRAAAEAHLPKVDRPATPPARSFTRAENLAAREDARRLLGTAVRSSTTARELLSAHLTKQRMWDLQDLQRSAAASSMGSLQARATDAPRIVERAASTVEGLKMQARALGITPSDHTKRWLTQKVTEGLATKPNALAAWRASGRLAPALVAVSTVGAYMTLGARDASAKAQPKPAAPTGAAPRPSDGGPVAVTYTTGPKAGTTEYRRRPNT